MTTPTEPPGRGSAANPTPPPDRPAPYVDTNPERKPSMAQPCNAEQIKTFITSLGVNPDLARRVLIDIQHDGPVMVYVERFADARAFEQIDAAKLIGAEGIRLEPEDVKRPPMTRPQAVAYFKANRPDDPEGPALVDIFTGAMDQWIDMTSRYAGQFIEPDDRDQFLADCGYTTRAKP